MTLEGLAVHFTPRILVNEALCVVLLALNMFVFWDSPGEPWGIVVTVVVSVFVIGQVWMLPRRHLRPLSRDAAIDPNGAAKILRRVADPALRMLLLPTLIGFAATLLSQGWLPIFFGAMISLGGYTFLGPFRTQLGRWRDRLEVEGGKTGL
jgi:hypothetical protein